MATCKRCGQEKTDEELNGIQFFEKGRAKYAKAYCQKTRDCKSAQTDKSVKKIIDALSDSDKLERRRAQIRNAQKEFNDANNRGKKKYQFSADPKLGEHLQEIKDRKGLKNMAEVIEMLVIDYRVKNKK